MLLTEPSVNLPSFRYASFHRTYYSIFVTYKAVNIDNKLSSIYFRVTLIFLLRNEQDFIDIMTYEILKYLLSGFTF